MSDGHIAEKPVYHVAPKEVSPAATARPSPPVATPLQQRSAVNDLRLPLTIFALYLSRLDLQGWVNGKLGHMAEAADLHIAVACNSCSQLHLAAAQHCLCPVVYHGSCTASSA